MPQTSLGKFFDSGLANRIEATVDKVVDDFTKPVGKDPFVVKSFSIDAGQPNISVFNTPVKLGATASLGLQILKDGTTVTPFDDGVAIAAPKKTSFARLDIAAKLQASASGGGNAGTFAISGEGSVTAGLNYYHLYPVPQSQNRLVALIDAVSKTELPQMASLKDLEPGQVLHFDAMLNVDLGIKAKYGAEAGIDEVVAITSDLSAPVQAHVQLTAEASLGFGLYEELSVTVARAGTRNDGWVRVRVARKHSNRITFGAAFTLAVSYDAAAGAQLILDKAFSQLQMPELVTTANQILSMATQPWSVIKTQLTQKASAAMVTLVGDMGWKDWVDGSDEVKNFLEAASWITGTYDKLEAKVQSIYDELIARLDDAGLAKVKAGLQKVIDFDPNAQLDALIGDDADKVVQLIELLSGKDLEELVLSGSVAQGIKDAQAMAKKVLDTINGASGKVTSFVQGLAQRTGVKSVVDFLKKFDTADELKAQGDAFISSTVEKLVGKALDQINDDDVKRLQAFLTKVQPVLIPSAALHQKLKTKVEKLKGEFTFSFSIEVSRVLETSAVADLEIDPSSSAAVSAARFLTSGNIDDMLRALDNIGDEDDLDKPFDIRQLVLTSRRVRTSATALFFSFVGMTRTKQSRIEELTLTIEGGPNVANQRSALYAGGNVIRREDGAATAEGAAFVRIDAKSDVLDRDEPFAEAKSSIRLTYVREDRQTLQGELDSMRDLLAQTGFLPPGKSFDAPPEGVPTRFALEIDLPEEAVAGLITDIAKEEEWNLDVRNAGHRWFSDKGVANKNDLQIGTDIAKVLKAAPFAQTWTKSTTTGFINAMKTLGVWDVIHHRIQMKYLPLDIFIRNRSTRYGRYKGFKPLAGLKPDDAAKATSLAATLFANGGIDWNLPLLNFWLVLARLSHKSPGTLAKGKGVATFRWRPSAQADWNAPQWFTLTDGTGIPAGALAQQFTITA